MLLALAHSVATEVRPKDLQKSVYQCRVMGNRGSGKASGTTGGGREGGSWCHGRQREGKG